MHPAIAAINWVGGIVPFIRSYTREAGGSLLRNEV